MMHAFKSPEVRTIKLRALCPSQHSCWPFAQTSVVQTAGRSPVRELALPIGSFFFLCSKTKTHAELVPTILALGKLRCRIQKLRLFFKKSD